MPDQFEHHLKATLDENGLNEHTHAANEMRRVGWTFDTFGLGFRPDQMGGTFRQPREVLREIHRQGL